MQPDTQTASNPMWMSCVGWIITLLAAAFLIMSAVMKLVPPADLADFLVKLGLRVSSADIAEMFTKLGWNESSKLGLAIVELSCVAIYLFPRTALLGAILLAGYLGGAAATHVRIGDAFVPQIIVGVVLWFGLFLRDGRLRALIPWRGDPSVHPIGGFLAACAKIFLTLVVIVGVMFAISTALPIDYRVTRSTTIAASASEIFPHVNDFHKWKQWTPWLDDDPAATVTIEGSPGKDATYKWSGNNKVGEGKMTLIESEPNERVKVKLEFLRRMPATADAEFTFKADGDKTIVTWTITGERDLIGRAFGSVFGMDMMIGGNFEKGLARMKAVAEGGPKK
jgi:uncharacterized protein YndB with AHSA1/START domain